MWCLSLGLWGSGMVIWVSLLIHLIRVSYEGHFNDDDDVNSSDNVCSPTHTCGCVVDGSVARTASEEVRQAPAHVPCSPSFN